MKLWRLSNRRMDDYTFMQTGLAGGHVPSTTSATDERQLQALVLVFLEEAMALATRYATFKGFEDAEPQHIIACLKVHAQRGMSGLCRVPDADARLEDYANLLLASDSDEDDSNEDAEHEHTFDRLTDAEMAAMVEFAESRWDSWEPGNAAEALLKRAVERTAEHFEA